MTESKHPESVRVPKSSGRRCLMRTLLWKGTCHALAMELAMARFGAPGPHVFADRLLLEIAALERETQGLLESALESRPLRCALCSVSPLWCAISSEDRGPGAHLSGPLLQPHDAPGAGRGRGAGGRRARRAFYFNLYEKAPACGDRTGLYLPFRKKVFAYSLLL